jgi:hypothetical protein
VRVPFREFTAGTPEGVLRPMVDVYMQGIPQVPVACLLDTGAVYNRFSDDLAEAAGVSLDGLEEKEFAVGAAWYRYRRATDITLSIGEHSWTTSVCFVQGWDWQFQLLGQEDFFRWFDVCFYAADQQIELELARH